MKETLINLLIKDTIKRNKDFFALIMVDVVVHKKRLRAMYSKLTERTLRRMAQERSLIDQ